jgi:hypothetical protein
MLFCKCLVYMKTLDASICFVCDMCLNAVGSEEDMAGVPPFLDSTDVHTGVQGAGHQENSSLESCHNLPDLHLESATDFSDSPTAASEHANGEAQKVVQTLSAIAAHREVPAEEEAGEGEERRAAPIGNAPETEQQTHTVSVDVGGEEKQEGDVVVVRVEGIEEIEEVEASLTPPIAHGHASHKLKSRKGREEEGGQEYEGTSEIPECLCKVGAFARFR